MQNEASPPYHPFIRPHEESKSWNPILEISETASALARHMTDKTRDFKHERTDAERANQKFREHHVGEIIDIVINDVLYLIQGKEGEGLQRHELPHKGEYEGFREVIINGVVGWFMGLKGDAGILIPVGELKNTAQIVSFNPVSKPND